MSSQRFSREFRDEAVRQITKRRYSVADVAQCLGISSHSLYKWVKAVTTDKTAQHSQELFDAKSSGEPIDGGTQHLASRLYGGAAGRAWVTDITYCTYLAGLAVPRGRDGSLRT